jgi:hypothetical protein
MSTTGGGDGIKELLYISLGKKGASTVGALEPPF